MCGRYAVTTDQRVIAARFEATRSAGMPERHPPRPDIRPSEDVLVIALGADRARKIVPMRWWLVPHFEPTPSTRLNTFNARAENIGHSDFFGPSFHAQRGKGGRCLIPFDAFFEFSGPAGKKTRHEITVLGNCMQAFAGVYSIWRPSGPHTARDITLLSCSIITVQANDLVGQVHDRMPAILDDAAWPLWLGEVAAPAPELLGLLRPFPAERMAMSPDTPASGDPKLL